jgi:phage terminase small subunit
MDMRSERIEITADEVLEEIEKLAFGNIKNLYDKDGKLIPIQDLPDDISATLQEVTEESINAKVIKRKYKLSNKKGNLELLGKHLNLFTDKKEIKHCGEIKTGINWIASDDKT